MTNLLFFLIESPIIRYSLYEQIYDKFYIPKGKFSLSVSNYIADIKFGNFHYNFNEKFGFSVNYLNSGKMYRTDEFGNVLDEFYLNFINFCVYRNFVVFNIHYETYYFQNTLNLSLGTFYRRSFRDINFTLMANYLGLNTPVVFGIETNYKNMNLGILYELDYKFIYNFTLKLPIAKGINIYAIYTNRYEDFRLSRDLDILVGSMIAMDINFKRYKIGYGMRFLSDYGFINTIQVLYE
ncbi:MAG: hypothetical protein N2504_05710 [candidate division WOR-3 bacterium]|nr:hypothetical protein [candidate division WOR-3 bacterium]MCX7948066.1 hypothetical protein [candidate division WOR-3 bacterium]MDW8150996.1 hypothetical protein [candidate division WOR-3 bacterium]